MHYFGRGHKQAHPNTSTPTWYVETAEAPITDKTKKRSSIKNVASNFFQQIQKNHKYLNNQNYDFFWLKDLLILKLIHLLDTKLSLFFFELYPKIWQERDRVEYTIARNTWKKN